MKNVNTIALLLYFTAMCAIFFGVYVQVQFDTSSDGLILLVSVGSLVAGLLLLGIAEMIRLLSKISRKLTAPK
ncbi:hypothetical protein [Alkalihalophilus marmarensis]|uniref:hypothetical protein n=1 Tax=Alkalihalophilus marmarensis TaxID=521377 RepID=UPI002E1D68DF|nr:hypothetical protein [Alkalihalophilus marmarensis]